MAKYLRRSFRRGKKEVRFMAGNVVMENEDAESSSNSTPRYRPDGIEALCTATGFTRKELQLMYRSFKQECPTGTVNEATFKRIYTHFFPYGDVSPYAHCVFRAFDTQHNGIINFEELVMGVASLSRGTVPDKLRWVFTLYDADGDGVISRTELRDVVMAVHRLSPHGNWLTSKTCPPEMMGFGALTGSNAATGSAAAAAALAERRRHELIAERQADRIFQKLDLNCDGQVTWEEFLETCTKDETIYNTMNLLDVSI